MLNRAGKHVARCAFAAAIIFTVPVSGSAQKSGELLVGLARTTAPANPAVYQAAQSYRGTKILVSTNERRLRLVSGRDTLLDVPVGIGKGEDFEYEGRRFRFETPTGRRRVLAKAENPVWTVPDWHYMEKATYRGLELVRLKDGDEIELEDGSSLVVKDGQVGRVNQFGNFWAFTPGTEIIFDGKIFMPPFGTEQRKVPEALGPYKLDMGDGYLLHGTNPFNEETIGGAVSHGCVRLSNEHIDRLYHLVETGTAVFIY
ncbi:MAG TPA: L,D-transpeptidase [Longimicrobiales bacterium]|nr:L,D-transpeptidase [Longimicrobiales bacterium]